jgi:MFS family permease
MGTNAKILGATGFLANASTEMLIPLLPLFLTKVLLAPVLVVGLMESLDGFVTGIRSLLARLRPSGGKRTVVAGYTLSAIVKSLLVSASAWPQVAAIRVLAGFGDGIAERPQEAMLSQESGAEEASGFRRMLGNMGAIVGPLVAALILVLVSTKARAYGTVFLLAAVLAILAVPALFFLREKPSQQPKTVTDKPARMSLPFLAFTAILALGQFSVMFFILRAADFLPLVLIPIAYLAYNVFCVIFSMPAGILADRLGFRAAMLLGMLSLLLALAGAAFFPSLIVLLVAFALLGVSVAALKTVPQAFLSRTVRKECYASAMGSYKGLTGIMGLPANLLAGLLWTVPLFGAPAPFVFSIATTIAAVLLLLVVKD